TPASNPTPYLYPPDSPPKQQTMGANRSSDDSKEYYPPASSEKAVSRPLAAPVVLHPEDVRALTASSAGTSTPQRDVPVLQPVRPGSAPAVAPAPPANTVARVETSLPLPGAAPVASSSADSRLPARAAEGPGMHTPADPGDAVPDIDDVSA